jgi:peroxiredoxin
MKLIGALLLAAMTVAAAGDYSNRRAPGFSLADSHYQQHDPQDYRGKVLLVDIMVTTCPICIQLADTLVQVKAKYGDKIGIISVMTLPDSHDTGDRFAAQHKITWPLVFDSGQMIMSYLKVTPQNPRIHFPHLFLIDPNGIIRNDYDETDGKLLTVEGISAAIDKILK